MKIRIIFNFAATLLVFLLLSSGCTKDFTALNTNPNSPSIAQAAPNMLLTNAIESMTERVDEIFFGHEMGSCWVQHMAKVQYTTEDQYVPRMSVINNTWASFYASSGYDIQTIYNIADATKNDSYKALALILKTYVVSVLTDYWGDVPYTEAFLGSDPTKAILSPAYDTQESIYVALLKNLDDANTLLAATSTPIKGDILFNNDLTKWRKFANSLSLRLLMRRSDRVAPTAAITAIVSDPAKYPIFESNADNAALAYLGSAPNNNPINENRKTRDDHRVSKTLVDQMWTNQPNMDFRLVVYANRVGTGFDGLPNGLSASDAANYKGNGLTKTCKMGDYFTAATSPGTLMSYAELQFILAEAVQRGFVTGSAKTAEDYYNAGILGSYKQFESTILANSVAFGFASKTWVIADYVADYMSNYAAFDPANALNQIYTEKWVAMFDQGVQAVLEWRRTNVPVLVPAVGGQNGGKIPVRAYYPSSESGTNPTNLKAAIARQGADDLNTKVWWDTTNNY